jgi:adenosylcobinamide-GDP ribazoletransferase
MLGITASRRAKTREIRGDLGQVRARIGCLFRVDREFRLSDKRRSMKRFVRAFQYLTLARRFARAGLAPADIGAAAVYFPFVGLSLGLVLVGINSVLEPHLESEILAAVHVTILILLTGAIHLEELQKTFDGTAAAPDSAPASSIRVPGLLAVMLAVFFKIRSLEVIGEGRPLTLLVVPVLARWLVVLFLYGTMASAEPVGRIVERIKAWHLLLTSVMALAIAAYGLRLPGLWLGFSVSLLTLLSRTLLQRCSGGLRRDHLGAVIELGEALSFVLIASF